MTDRALKKVITEVLAEVLTVKDEKIKLKTKKGKIKMKFSSSKKAAKTYDLLQAALSLYLFKKEKAYQRKKAI